MHTRRDFLKLLGVTGAVVVAEPVRRIWQVGVELQAPEPGTVRLSDGTVVRLRDFQESDKYDTIVIKADVARPLDYDMQPRAYSYNPHTDPHTQLAAHLMKLPIDQAIKHPRFPRFRNLAKSLSFGSRYGANMNPENLRKKYGFPADLIDCIRSNADTFVNLT